MPLKIVTRPGNDPVSLEEAKSHLRVDFDYDDDLITAFISAATEYVDGPKGFLGRALVQQTWDLYADKFPCEYPSGRPSYIEIPLPPLISVDGVFYLDADGNEQQWDDSNYSVDFASEPARVVIACGVSWPAAKDIANSVRIRFTAGYVDSTNSPPTDSVPSSIKAAILLHVGDLYANRETMSGTNMQTVPWAAEQILRRHRIYLSLA